MQSSALQFQGGGGDFWASGKPTPTARSSPATEQLEFGGLGKPGVIERAIGLLLGCDSWEGEPWVFWTWAPWRFKLEMFKEGVFGCIRSDVSGIQRTSIIVRNRPAWRKFAIWLYPWPAWTGQKLAKVAKSWLDRGSIPRAILAKKQTHYSAEPRRWARLPRPLKKDHL
jgi:hypothetical protein